MKTEMTLDNIVVDSDIFYEDGYINAHLALIFLTPMNMLTCMWTIIHPRMICV